MNYVSFSSLNQVNLIYAQSLDDLVIFASFFVKFSMYSTTWLSYLN